MPQRDTSRPGSITSEALLALPEIRHRFFTRHGGVSGGIYTSLNCGFGSQDETVNVSENRKRVCDEMDLGSYDLVTAYQTHSNRAVIVEKPWLRENAPEADAIVTNMPGLQVAILTADCAPVLFADPEAGVVAAAHSGWRGAFSGILENTVLRMEELGAKRSTITVAVGPAISQISYEVGPEFYETFLSESSSYDIFFLPSENNKFRFNLTGFVEFKLKQLSLSRIEVLNICTVQNESKYYSYRRSVLKKEPDYGRQISVIGLVK